MKWKYEVYEEVNDLEGYKNQCDVLENGDELLSLLGSELLHFGLKLQFFILFNGKDRQCHRIDKNGKTLPFTSAVQQGVDQNVLDDLRQSAISKQGAFHFMVVGNTVVEDMSGKLNLPDVCIPLRGPYGLFALAWAKKHRNSNEPVSIYVDLLATVFFQRYCSIFLLSERFVELTMRERQVLKAVSQGETKKRIAEAMGVTNHTIDFHYRNIMKKYGVTKIVVAVVSAVKEGVI